MSNAKSKYNRKVVCIDLDGVLADFYFAMTKWLSDTYGKPDYPIGSYQAEGWGVEELGLQKMHLDKFWEWVYDGGRFWSNLREMEPGIVSRLYWGMPWDTFTVYFCTTREDTKTMTAQRQSHNWLSGYGWDCPNVIVSDRKGDFCKSVDAAFFLDDKFSNCVEVCEKSPDTAVFWLALKSQQKYLSEAYKHPNMKVIYHFREFEKAMQEVICQKETSKLI